MIKSFIKSAIKTSDISELTQVISAFKDIGAKCNYDPISADENRLLIHSSRYNAQKGVTAECNGTILDYATWEVLYQAPRLPNGKFDVNKVTENFALYDVYPLCDGTVIGLYHYNESWRICTTHGIDMNKVSWCGITYLDALTEAFVAAGIAWDSFTPGRTYTMGFTHPKMHYTQKLDVWMISSATHMCQEPVHFKSLVEVQMACGDSPWGFILRSYRPAVTLENSVVLMESNRMAKLRASLYDRHVYEDATALGITRFQYAYLKSFGNESIQENFVYLYPAYQDLQTRAIADINKFAKDIFEHKIFQGQKNKIAKWLWNHLSAVSPITKIGDIVDFLTTRTNVDILRQYLQESSLMVD